MMIALKYEFIFTTSVYYMCVPTTLCINKQLLSIKIRSIYLKLYYSFHHRHTYNFILKNYYQQNLIQNKDILFSHQFKYCAKYFLQHILYCKVFEYNPI